MEQGLREASKKSSKGLDQDSKRVKIEGKGDKVFLPHFEKPRSVGDEKEYPFHLINYKLMTTAEGRGANQPFLQEILGPHLKERWDSWVEINPETAREMGIKDGDLIWVESKVGKVKSKGKAVPWDRSKVYPHPLWPGP